MGEEELDTLSYLGKMPYNWAALAGYFLGIPNNLRFGGNCIEQAVLTRNLLPRGTVRLQVDRNFRHFATLIDNSYFDPTYYQYTTEATYTPWEDEMVHPTLIEGTNILVRERGNYTRVRIGYQGGMYNMSGIIGPENIYMQRVLDNFSETIYRIPPFINFPNVDGIETSVSFLPKFGELTVRDRSNAFGFSPEGRLQEMEATYGFTRDELLGYFVDIWRGISRLKNT